MTEANVVACLENPLYRQYIEEEFQAAKRDLRSVGKEDLAEALAEKGTGVLLLQSDSAEPSMIVLSSKIKRLFGDDFSMLMLSADYRTVEEVGTSVDAFLQYPAAFKEIDEVIDNLFNRTKRILIVDDSKLVHNHLVPSLKENGYEVHDAFDGAQGLEMAKQVKPDVVICDIEMPNMNGFECCAGIRKTEDIANTYLIMSSTLGSASDQQKGFRVGVDEYITKPVIISELLARLDNVFNASRTGREHVLILDDQEQIARTISTGLAKQGFSTRTVSTLKETIRVLKRVGYDLIITEINVADGTLIDLIRLIGTLPTEFQPDVVAMTSRENEGDEKMVINAGAAGVITKPFTMDSLSASVERALADRRSRQEKEQLSKYVSKASMRMALEKSIMGGKKSAARAYRKHGTIFFSDVVSFTSRCERYEPKEIVRQINKMFEVMTQVIMKHEGDIDKFIGDACMAFWMEEDSVLSASNAIKATLEIRKALEDMNEADAVLSKDPIHIRIGINTGEIILCDIGSADARIDLTIIGDAVNVAARFESGAKQYGLDILVGDTTMQPHMSRYASRLVDLVRVKGKEEPLLCHELFHEHDVISPEQRRLIEEFNKGMDAYRVGKFEEALGIFQETDKLELVEGNMNPSRLYQDRCQQLIENPPEEWQGVWTLTSK